MLVGWFALPYALVGTVWFFAMFPVLFWGFDIYDEDRWRYHLWRTVFLMLLTGAALDFFTPFDVGWLVTGNFWLSALNFSVWIAAYLGIGVVYAYVRWFFYHKEYNRRVRERLGENPTKLEIKDAYATRLSGYGSRLSLILKWIFHWPWSAIAWILTDMLREFFDFVFRRLRAFFGAGFGAMARADERKVFPEFAELEKAAQESRQTKET